MTDSIFTSLIDYSLTEAQAQFAERLNDDSTFELIKNNTPSFLENLTFGHGYLFMSVFLDCTLQNYHKFLCILLKERGIDISDLEDFRYYLND
jgi:hypothetical protein